jgi:hypothetical protein
MRRGRLIKGLLLLALSGCATTGNFKQQMDSWLGSDINSAIMRFGPPSNTYVLPNGTRMFTWLWVGNTVVTANYNEYLNMVTAGRRTSWCQFSFSASQRGIEAWQANGNACRATK